MHRCLHIFSLPFPKSDKRMALSALLLLPMALAVTAFLAAPAKAQVQSSLGAGRNFPEAALRGTLTITGSSQAQLDGRDVRMAPGMRLMSPNNTLVMAHTVLGQSFTVNYVLEASTGWLLTAWILNNAEAAQPRRSSSPANNFRFESDAASR